MEGIKSTEISHYDNNVEVEILIVRKAFNELEAIQLMILDLEKRKLSLIIKEEYEVINGGDTLEA